MFKNLDNTSSIILSLAVLLLGGALYFLMNEHLFVQQNENATDRIGYLKFVNNDVRRKPVGTINWINLSKPIPLYVGDSIFTGKNSDAVVELDNSTDKIFISQNSLVTLNRDQNELQLEINFGKLETDFKKSQSFLLKKGSKIYKFKSKNKKPTGINLTSIKYEPLKIKMTKGDVEVKSTSINKKINDAETVTIKDLSYEKPSSTYNLQEIPSVQEVAPPVVVAPTPTPTTSPNIALRVPQSEDDNEEEPEKTEEPDKKPNKKDVVVKKIKPKAKQPQFGQIKIVKQKNIVLSSNTNYKTSDKSVKSNPNKFAIYKPAEINWDYDLVGSTKTNSYPVNKPNFNVVVSSGSKPVLKKDTSTNSLKLTDIPPGSYEVSITPMDPKSNTSGDTIKQKLTVSLTKPSPLAKKEYIDKVTDLRFLKNPPPSITLYWSPTVFTPYYETLYSKNSNFSSPKSVISTSSRTSVDLNSFGTYYWKVRSLDTNKKATTDWSSTTTILTKRIYSNLEESKKFMNVSPQNKNSIVMVGNGDDTVQFVWSKPFKKGTEYRFVLSSNSQFTQIVAEKTTKSNRFLLNTKLPKGWLYWRVRAEWGEYSSEWTPVFKFKMVKENGL